MPEYPRTRNMCVQVMTIEQETITTICVQCHGTWFVYTADSTANWRRRSHLAHLGTLQNLREERRELLGSATGTTLSAFTFLSIGAHVFVKLINEQEW